MPQLTAPGTVTGMTAANIRQHGGRRAGRRDIGPVDVLQQAGAVDVTWTGRNLCWYDGPAERTARTLLRAAGHRVHLSGLAGHLDRSRTATGAGWWLQRRIRPQTAVVLLLRGSTLDPGVLLDDTDLPDVVIPQAGREHVAVTLVTDQCATWPDDGDTVLTVMAAVDHLGGIAGLTDIADAATRDQR
jgi:hypothetical protein